ncbi:MAG: hypothetical protein H0W83_03005, partial [Planctomycetes bacterium]|nr:hypothetical protein [Planctomycetota bacterium]
MRWRAVTAIAAAWLLSASSASGASVVAPDEASFATRVQLAAPLTTLVALPAVRVADGIAIDADVTVPEGAAEVGIGAFLSDAHGQWFQCLHPQPLHAGTNHIALRLDPQRPLESHPWVRSWTPAMAALADRAGLFVFSAGVGGALEMSGRLHALPPAPESPPRLLDCAAPATGRSGERWQFDCVPSPFPRNPFDPDEFALDAHISLPDGTEQVVPGFWWEPMRSSDRGDREDVT